MLVAMVAAGDHQVTKAVSEVTTVRDLMEIWAAGQEDRHDLASSTVDLYLRDARELATRLSDVRLDRITRATLEGYRDRALREGRSARLVNRHLRVLRLAWRWGQEVGASPPTALPAVKALEKGHQNCHYTPTQDEATRILTAMRQGWPRLVALMLWTTGARIGEVTTLDWSAVDLTGGWIRLDGKTGERTIPLHSALADALTALPHREGRVITAAAKTVRVNILGELARACSRTRVPRTTPHGLRRLAADTFARSGVDVATAARWLGHSPQVMLQVYREVTRDDLASARAVLGPAADGDEGDPVQARLNR